ncbi:pertactin [Frederiksenia canicola]|uniref:Pertactin n=1 Tax=Frederiksenia canicola TaxID=123824 RepID=A0AAE6X813_9PAST|nr:pertactin [Frederiksenia canicola]
MPVPPTAPSVPTQVVLSEKSNALVSLRQAQLLQLEQSLAGLHQRLGEIKQGENGNVWVRNLNSRSDFAATKTAENSQSSGFKQDFHGIQIGTDANVSENLRLGGFVGKERSDVDFNGEYGSGKISGQSVGLYGTYQTDSGLYFDNIAKFSRLNVSSKGTEKRRYHAYTLSSEIGKIFTFGDQWTVTPNAQLAWTTLSGKADEQRISSLYSRIGTRLAKVLKVGEWQWQPYAELNAVTAKNSNNQVNVNQYRFDVAASRGRVETALGLNLTKGSHRFGIEAKTTNGKYLDQPLVIQAGYRYSW